MLGHAYNFTESVRRILATAREEAHRLHHEFVGTEHILLALLHSEPSVATAVLRDLGVDFDAVRSVVYSTVKTGKSDRPSGSDLPYTSRAKKTLELAMQAARDLGHDYVGSEHLLLGIIREEKGIAAQVLASFGALPENARAAVIRHPEVPAPSTIAAPTPGHAAPLTGARDHRLDSVSSAIAAGAPKRPMYTALSWGIIALALLHLLGTFRLYPDVSSAAMQYVGTGLLLLLAGVLNLLNIAGGWIFRALILTTVTVNAVLTVFVVAAGVVAGSSRIAVGIIGALIAAVTLLSARPLRFKAIKMELP